ncbi:hypothetical protein Tco_0227515 [Tanacetum coccineum]
MLQRRGKGLIEKSLGCSLVSSESNGTESPRAGYQARDQGMMQMLRCSIRPIDNEEHGNLISTGNHFNLPEEGLRAPFLNVQMMSVHISSGLVLHQMMSDHNSSDLAPQRQEMSVEMSSLASFLQGQKASDYGQL